MEIMFDDGEGGIQMRLKIIKIIYHFHYEGNVLAVTLNDAHGISGFRGTQFEHR